MFYLIVKRDDLVSPMIGATGDAPEGTAPMRPAPTWRLLVAATLAAAGTLWIAGFF